MFSLATWLNGMAFRDINFSLTGRPVIKIAEIKNGLSGQTKYTEAEYDPALLVKSGDMLFSWSGQPETSIDVSWWRGRDGWLNQHIFKVLPDTDRCTIDFFFYLLKYLRPSFVGIARNKQTTGLGHVTRRDLEAITVGIPSLSEQRAIASILGALDDQIELNRKMSATLEAMAQALFKSWFVDFDPVRAKAEGRDTGLPPEIAALFPDSLEAWELGEIPTGWRITSLGDITSFEYGKPLKAEDRRKGPIAVYGSNGIVGWHDEPLVSGPGVVIGRKGNPGTVTWAQNDFFPIDTTFYAMPKAQDCLHFLFHALRDQDLAHLSADSAVPGLNRNQAYMSKQVLPPSKLLTRFDSTVAALFRRGFQAAEESKTLAALRDALLPKLISGELRVTDAERILEKSA